MKICHITSVHKENDVRIELKELTSLAKQYESYLLIYNTSETNKPYRIVDIGNKYNSRVKRILFSKKNIFRKALEIDADLYHLHDPELIGVARKLKSKNKIVIFDFHEDTPKQILSKHYIPKILRKPLSLIYKIYEEKSSSKFDGIVTATPYLERKFVKHNKNTVAINNFPILSEFTHLNNNFANKEIDLIYIGGISGERGLFEMIKIANDKPNLKITLCGRFISSEEEKKAMQMIKFDNIKFKGMLNRTQIQKELEKAKVGLVLLEKNERFSESLPIKMFEYMAAGIPVIATQFKLWEKIIKESSAGICINPKDTNDIIKKIEMLLSNPILMKKMGDSGRNYVTEKYNWENEEKKLLNLYKKLEEN
ncbi:glycosyltransferase [Macrococcoides canis]|uniref:glycosyltransferase n=1 Tax=Macrococcoides canis TaxID=1855823 RepID=UPI00105B8379|nr:glycosyltransferase [Macrococcus canis]TDM20845.1 glycosyltransferase [Macrococcus canis]